MLRSHTVKQRLINSLSIHTTSCIYKTQHRFPSNCISKNPQFLLFPDTLTSHIPTFFLRFGFVNPRGERGVLVRCELEREAMKPSRLLQWVFWACMAVFLGCGMVECSVTYDRRAMVINGQRRILISGSIHYPRSTPEVLKLQSFCAPFEISW